MKRLTCNCIFLLAGLCVSMAYAQEVRLEKDYPLKPVPFNRVKLQDQFWLPRLQIQAKTTVPHAIRETEPAVERLRLCAAFQKTGEGPLPQPHRFISSDLFKVMEGAAYTLMIRSNPNLEKELDAIIEVIAAAQQPDGYLYVSHTCGNPHPGEMGQTPYSWIVHSHELYNMGHMYEGAIAYYRATGKDNWLKLAEKSAQHFNRVIFEGDPKYNNGKPLMQAPGHQELEIALCKLYRATGKQLYLDMAQKFLDMRGVTYRPEGEGTMSPTYAQQHRPVVEQEKAVGHAVRAGYLYAGMADVSALTGDMRYARAAERIWHDVVDTKMHLIGGLGATHGIEGFGPPYDLPNRDTYNETCAAVANVFFNFRMYLMHRDATYFDVAEVALLNNALAGISLKGDSFFYVNVLEADGIKKFNHGSGGRSPWFGCACCPSNLARLMPQVSGYMYTHTTDEVYLGLYGSSQTQIALDAGKVSINQVTDYPFDGHIALEVEPDQPHDFTLQLRIPTWVRERFVPGALYHYIDDVKPAWTVKVNGKRVKTDVNKGFAAVRRTWKRGDRVELDLPMPVRFSAALDHVKANRGRLAVTRGPLVYCAEQADNGNAKVQRFFMPKPCDSGRIQQTTIRQGPLKGITKISLPGQEVIENSSRTTKVNMIPYYAWNNRGEDSMIIWMPRTRDMAAASMVSNLLTQSDLGEVRVTHTKAGDSIAAVVDGAVPNSSADQRGPRWTSLPFKNNRQDITISFPETRRVTRVLVYWYQDPGKGEVRLPRDWWIDTRLCRKSPPSARERAIFSSGNDGEAGDIGVIVDAAGSSQGEKGPLEARASFPTEPKSDHDDWKRMKKYVTDFYGLEPNQFNMVRPDAPLTCNRLRISVLPQQGYCMGIHEIQVEFE